MNDDKYSKRRLFGSLSWLIVGVYVALTVWVISTDIPFSVTVIVVPLLNVVLIGTWFLVRTFYNNANDSIEHSKNLISKATILPPAKYGGEHRSEYIPDIKVNTDLFNSIKFELNNVVSFDITLKDYLKPERIIIFHDEMNYGVLKEVKVSKVTIHENDIEVSFYNSY